MHLNGNHNPSNSQQGFTIIELLITVSIIGLLSSVVLASTVTVKDKADNLAKTETIRQYQIALEEYYNDHGGYPESSNNYYVCLGLSSSEECLPLYGSGPWYGDDNLLNVRLADYIRGAPPAAAKSLMATIFSDPPVTKDFRGILYINGGSPSCSNMLCKSYFMSWELKGIRQNCSPGFRMRCGTDVNEYYPYGITQCGLNVPAQPTDEDAPWC